MITVGDRVVVRGWGYWPRHLAGCHGDVTAVRGEKAKVDLPSGGAHRWFPLDALTKVPHDHVERMRR